jgi:3-deoxy-D-manno-octulosonate 8-phosphate phosphatase KdsC-like HAD superfamily phosphatase
MNQAAADRKRPTIWLRVVATGLGGQWHRRRSGSLKICRGRSAPAGRRGQRAADLRQATVTTLLKLLAVPLEQIATLRDMSNDVLMFRKSGFSIAMDNASAKVKSQSNEVTDSNENEGFAKAVQQFLLA